MRLDGLVPLLSGFGPLLLLCLLALLLSLSSPLQLHAASASWSLQE
jgi:hypothetical protein